MSSSTSMGRPAGHDGDELSAIDRRRAAYRQLIDGELATSDGERVLFNITVTRKKYAELQRDPRVSVFVLDGDNWYR